MSIEERIEELHSAVYAIYQEVHRQAPQVRLDPTEGELGRLWAEIDYWEAEK